MLRRRRIQGQRTLGLVLAAALASTAGAARQPVLKFLKNRDLPAIGLRLKVPHDAQEVPLPPPSVYTYTSSRGGKTARYNMYDPSELWRHSQQCGKWVDAFDTQMILAAIGQPPPAGFRSKHVSREEFDQRVAEAKNGHADWTDGTLGAWIAAFTGLPNADLEPVPRPPARFRQLLRVKPASQPPNQFAYAFEIRRTSATRSQELPAWFFVFFQVNPQSDLDQTRQTIEQRFLPSVTAIVPPRGHDAGPSEKFQTALLKRGDKSPEFQASCRQVVASMRGLPGWWYVETENYIILSNMSTRHRILVRDLQEDLEALRTAYEQFLPPRKPISAVSTVRVFAGSDEYERHVGSNYKWTAGIWMPDKRELVIRPMTWGTNRQQRKRVLQTVYHEAFHQYVHYAMDMIQTSAWYNEGHAELFETVEFRNGRLELNENDDHVRRIATMLRSGRVDLPRLLRMSYPDFYSPDEEILRANYTLAWAFVYYLRKGAERERSSPYGSLLGSYIDTLWARRDPAAATSEVFAKTDMDALLADFADFWHSSNRRSAARRYRLFDAGSRRR